MINLNELREIGATMDELNELLDRLEAAEKERDKYKVAYNEWCEKTEWVQEGINNGAISPKYLGWHRADVSTDLLKGAEKERDALRTRIEALEHDDFGALPDDVVEQAVNRFLSWKLPKDFHPDGGMAFIPTKGRGYDNQPVQRFVGRRNAQEREPAMQDALMKFDPATGEERPYPSHATQWRNWHGGTAWLFDPWTGRRRNAHDVGSDVQGLLIEPAGTLGMDMGGGCAEAKL